MSHVCADHFPFWACAYPEPVPLKDQFLLGYGGLRGAITFALATILLDDEALCDENGVPFIPFEHRNLIVCFSSSDDTTTRGALL